MLDPLTALAAVIAALAAVAATFVAIRNARDSIEALETPFLIPDYEQLDGWIMPWEGGTIGRNFYLKTPLFNAGRGAALMGDVRLVVDGRDVLDSAGGQVAIRAGGSRVYPLNVLGEPPPAGQEGLLRIYYCSASGEEYMTETRFKTETKGILCTSYVREDSDGGDRPFLFQSVA
jgi:hypothetical protein